MMCRLVPWKLLILIPLLGLSTGEAWSQEPASSIKWRQDYSSARKEAQEKNLPLLIDFGTTNCVWCKKLHETTFRDSSIVATLNQKFVPVLIDAERDPELASRLRITGYPTIVLAGPEGKILNSMEGYQDVGRLNENLQRVLSSVVVPDWMQRDYQVALKSTQSGDYARAVSTIKTILDDGKDRTLQTAAQKLLDEIEQKAGERVSKAKQLQEQGQNAEAIPILTEAIRVYPGTKAGKEASELFARLVQSLEMQGQQRTKRAQELLAQAKDFYKNKEYIPCLDRCEILVSGYGDLAEGVEGSLLFTEIKNNSEWMQTAADTMTERLGGVYLALADTMLKKGQPQRAEYYLQRVMIGFPGSRQAESAQIRLSQLQGVPLRNVVQTAHP